MWRWALREGNLACLKRQSPNCTTVIAAPIVVISTNNNMPPSSAVPHGCSKGHPLPQHHFHEVGSIQARKLLSCFHVVWNMVDDDFFLCVWMVDDYLLICVDDGGWWWLAAEWALQIIQRAIAASFFVNTARLLVSEGSTLRVPGVNDSLSVVGPKFVGRS